MKRTKPFTITLTEAQADWLESALLVAQRGVPSAAPLASRPFRWYGVASMVRASIALQRGVLRTPPVPEPPAPMDLMVSAKATQSLRIAARQTIQAALDGDLERCDSLTCGKCDLCAMRQAMDELDHR